MNSRHKQEIQTGIYCYANHAHNVFFRSERKSLVNLPVLSLKHRGSDLAEASSQVKILSEFAGANFSKTLEASGIGKLSATGVKILQVNVGKLCNMTCRHCHVDAGPDRKAENMDRETVDACLKLIRDSQIRTIDLTGGAPEMNKNFRYFVTQAKELGCHVIDRCNLTILLANGFTDMPQFLADNEVEIVASLPCYVEENADAQRGDGSFQKSVKALQLLNDLGYGKTESLPLTLVYNPVGTGLPGNQSELEATYRQQLRDRYDIEFTRLFTITNMPISRFLEDLLEQEQFETYMQKLIDAYNPAAAAGVMCRETLSVSWDGKLYDCDFNQMLELGVACKSRSIIGADIKALDSRRIVTNSHCFGCAAGAGSGCHGAINE